MLYAVSTDLAGETCLVTGALGGISGAASVEKFAQTIGIDGRSVRRSSYVNY